MSPSCDDVAQRPFWQALLLACTPLAVVALIEQYGESWRAKHTKVDSSKAAK